MDGRFWDCRADNLRFLCPNCHSQTSTYAGRNRRGAYAPLVRVDERGEPVHDPALPQRPSADAVLDRLERAEVTVADAARLLACHRNRIYRLRRRRLERGSLVPVVPRGRRQVVDPSIVIAFALAHPMLGPRALAACLAGRPADPVVVSHGTVSNILTAVGLNTRAARVAAASVRSEP
ncbi:helix-turn-helix domain-containing protein [Krasilnikovia sp. MM14-A1259]|uniref:helix-turn-helix domain-containing protein n=1 Tax=Krasilnikovia sp. MM14-A1259 TaxID=3373539 RepID=UPI00382C1C40